jgi:hypothetical protein
VVPVLFFILMHCSHLILFFSLSEVIVTGATSSTWLIFFFFPVEMASALKVIGYVKTDKSMVCNYNLSFMDQYVSPKI